MNLSWHNTGQLLIFFVFDLLFIELLPFAKIQFSRLSSPFLWYWIDIWYMNLVWHNTDQVWLLLFLNWLLTRYFLFFRFSFLHFLGHRSQRLQWPIVITRCPLSVVRRPLDYLHFRLLLQNRLMDFDETWYGWSTQGPLQVLLFFGQIRPGADPGRGKNRSRGVPFFKKLLLQTGRLQQQTECIAVI